MDIHAPDKPVHGFKDFLLHIAIVTLGILIALGLEGIRETVHDHRLVREARENFRLEMQDNHDHAQQEVEATTRNFAALQRIAQAPQGSALKSAGAKQSAIVATQNPFYFFSQTSWQTALSTGALAHMSADEVSAYAGAAESVRIYTALQSEAEHTWVQAFAFASVHPHPSATDADALNQQSVLLFAVQRTLAYVGPQMQASIDRALRAAAVR